MELPFSVTVGVTGRRNLPPDHLERISEQIHTALQTIYTVCDNIVYNNQAIFSRKLFDPSICSCLSEGADRLVAHKGLELGYFLDVTLPFHKDSLIQARDLEGDEQVKSRDELNKLFEKSRYKVDFSRDRENGGLENTEAGRKLRREAYLEAGLAMLEQSDIILALWDGKKDPNEGGTYDIIKRAIDKNIVVLWINTNEETPICEYVYARGSFRCEAIHNLTVRMENLFNPPNQFGFNNCIGDMKKEKFDTPLWASLYDKFYKLVAPKSPVVTTLADKKKAKKSQTTDTKQTQSPLKDVRIFSKLSGYYANLYRTFFLLNCLLGALAVTVAGIALALPYSYSPLKIGLGIAEIVLLCSLWYLHNQAQPKKGDWQHKSVNYRFLAEVVRHSNFLHGQGIALPVRTALPYYSTKVPFWVTWFSRTLLLSQKNAKKQDQIIDIQKNNLIGWVQDQLDYHRNKAERCERANRRIHDVVEKIFKITVACVIIHLLGKILSLSTCILGVFFSITLIFIIRPKKILSLAIVFAIFFVCLLLHFSTLINTFGLLSVLLPLWAMTLHALGQYAEFKRMQNRSLAMTVQLQKHKEDLQKASGSDEIIKAAEKAAETMLEEVNEWNIQSKMAHVVKG